MPSLAVLGEVRRQVQVPVLTAATATAGEVLSLLGLQQVTRQSAV
jgi:maleate cis-trans isomerase